MTSDFFPNAFKILFVYTFRQFDYDVSMYETEFILEFILEFLELLGYVDSRITHIWEVFDHYFFKYSFCIFPYGILIVYFLAHLFISCRSLLPISLFFSFHFSDWIISIVQKLFKFTNSVFCLIKSGIDFCS